MAKLDLAALVTATNGGSFLYATKAAAKPLIDRGMAEMNEAMTNPENDKEFAVRATEKGISEMDNANTPQEGTASDFEIFTVTKDEIKTRRKGAGRPDLYPFDKLPDPEGDNFPSFFVPATDARPEPWKSLGSTVSAASKRYATETGTETYKNKDGDEKVRKTYDYARKFTIRQGERNGVKGAIITRTK